MPDIGSEALSLDDQARLKRIRREQREDREAMKCQTATVQSRKPGDSQRSNHKTKTVTPFSERELIQVRKGRKRWGFYVLTLKESTIQRRLYGTPVKRKRKRRTYERVGPDKRLPAFSKHNAPTQQAPSVLRLCTASYEVHGSIAINRVKTPGYSDPTRYAACNAANLGAQRRAYYAARR